MHRMPLIATASVVGLLAAAGGAGAQSGTENYYVPPKIVKQGMPKSAIAGAGKVVVKVLVNKDGSPNLQQISIISSTNHGDDAAALDIARSAKYKAGTKGGKPGAYFYDYALTFTGAGAAESSASGSTSGLAQYERMIRAGNYAGAQAALKTYLAAHPDDQRAQVDLGVANTFLGDYQAAAAAFDKAGTIAQVDKSAAGKAYSEYAVAQIKAKNLDKGLEAAKKAVEYAPGYGSYNTLGFAEFSGGNYTAAITDLEKARSLGQSENADPKNRAQVDVNLISAYLAAGNLDMAKKIAAEVNQLSPGNAEAQAAIASYYIKQAQDKAAKGSSADAAALYEQAAQAVPSQAVELWSQAAITYLNQQPKPDNAKAKVDADKALALDPNSAIANYAAGVALANDGKGKDALVYLNKADTAAKAANNTNLATSIENAIKQLSGSK